MQYSKKTTCVQTQATPPPKRKRRSSSVTTTKKKELTSLVPSEPNIETNKTNDTKTISDSQNTTKTIPLNAKTENAKSTSKAPPKVKQAPLKSYPCHECSFKSSDRADMHLHLQQEHGIDTQSIVESAKNNMAHQTTTINLKSNTIRMPEAQKMQPAKSQNNTEVISSVSANGVQHQKNQFYPCYICKFQSKNKSEMLKHLQTTHDVDTDAISSNAKGKSPLNIPVVNGIRPTTGRCATIKGLPQAQEQNKALPNKKINGTSKVDATVNPLSDTNNINNSKNLIQPVHAIHKEMIQNIVVHSNKNQARLKSDSKPIPGQRKLGSKVEGVPSNAMDNDQNQGLSLPKLEKSNSKHRPVKGYISNYNTVHKRSFPCYLCKYSTAEKEALLSHFNRFMM